MEQAIAAALAEQGIAARGRPQDGPDYTGVWVGERKIASIGVHVSRGVTTHGFAVNVDNDLQPFSWVVACGLPDVQMTSHRRRARRRARAGARVLSQGDGLPLLPGARPRASGSSRPAPGHRRRARRRAAPTGAEPIETIPRDTRGGARMSATRSRAKPGGMDVLSVLGPDVRPLRERKPPWFKVPAPGGQRYRELTELIRSENLHTVCQEAACPNVGECWERGTATFMILGDTCTRRCGFCNVKTGKPTWNDPLEPARVARSIARMGLRHAVITSVDRDDLPDKGASAFVGVIRQVRRQAPDCQVEVLTPDFQGQEMPLAKVIAERPDVFNHNVEVVPRLYPLARRGSEFQRSCRVLRIAGEMGEGEVVTKSGPDGRARRDPRRARRDVRRAARATASACSPSGSTCARPSATCRSCATGTPTSSPRCESAAYELGFDHVAAGPLVRSSYHADQHVPQARAGVGPLAARAGRATRE